MAASEALLDLLRDLLAPVGAIAIKRMFSGAGIYCDGVMFGLVADDLLYLKADEATRARYEGEGLKPFTYQGKAKRVVMSYWRAPERAYDDPDEMVDWAREALQAARRAAQRKSSPKSRGAAKSAKAPRRGRAHS
jgi:DNA transformation protein